MYCVKLIPIWSKTEHNCINLVSVLDSNSKPTHNNCMKTDICIYVLTLGRASPIVSVSQARFLKFSRRRGCCVWLAMMHLNWRLVRGCRIGFVYCVGVYATLQAWFSTREGNNSLSNYSLMWQTWSVEKGVIYRPCFEASKTAAWHQKGPLFNICCWVLRTCQR